MNIMINVLMHALLTIYGIISLKGVGLQKILPNKPPVLHIGQYLLQELVGGVGAAGTMGAAGVTGATGLDAEAAGATRAVGVAGAMGATGAT